MASAVLGKVSPTPKGEYVSTKDYDRLDVVTYEGYPYLAKSNVPSGNLPTDELYWMPLLTGLDFAPGGYGLGETHSRLIPSSALLSEQVEGGMYYWKASNTDPNKPFTAGELLVIPRAGAGYIDQIAFGKDSTVPKVKIRQCLNAGSWSAWEDWSPSAFAPSGYGYGDNLYVGAEAGVSFTDKVEALTATWGSRASKQYLMYDADFSPYSLFGTIHKYSDTVTIIESTLINNGRVSRTKINGAWKPWEWETPPMQVGVGYRTTERYNGAAVYAKLVYVANLPNNASKTIDGVIDNGFTRLVDLQYTVNNSWTKKSHDSRVDMMVGVESPYAWLTITTTADMSTYSGYVLIKWTKD